MDKEEQYLHQLMEVVKRFDSNSHRVYRLLQVPADLVRKDRNKLPKEFKIWISDIFRASVVFLHASFEDALREIARLKLRECSGETLDGIPLAGISPGGQPRKFTLGALNKHRGKGVDELIQESIDEYLDRFSFNNSTDIANVFGQLTIDLSRVRKYFGDLDEMMLRRHQIVHRADQERISGKWRLASIDGNDVAKWTRVVMAFVFESITLAFPKEAMGYPQYKQLQQKLSELGMGKRRTRKNTGICSETVA
jgi:hypothetical protein